MDNKIEDTEVAGAPTKIQQRRAKQYEKNPTAYQGIGKAFGTMEEGLHGAIKYLYDGGLGVADIIESVVNISAQTGNPVPKENLNKLKTMVEKTIGAFKLDKTYDKPRFDPYAKKAARKEKKKNKNMENISE